MFTAESREQIAARIVELLQTLDVIVLPPEGEEAYPSIRITGEVIAKDPQGFADSIHILLAKKQAERALLIMAEGDK